MEKDGMADKSTFQIRGEGLEGGSNDKVVHDSQNEQKAYGEAKNGFKLQNEKSEALMAPATRGNNGKGWMVACIVAIAVLLVGGGVTVWMMLGKQDDSEVVAGDDVENGDNGSSNEGMGSSESVEELALDNSLVQRLYGNFAVVGEPYTGTMDFYTDKDVSVGNPSKELMLAIAVRVIPDNGYCKGNTEYMQNTSYSGTRECYDANAVKIKVKEIFGKDIELKDGDRAGNVSCTWQYNEKYNEFYQPDVGCGGTCFLSFNRTLNNAEKKEDEIYLYETVYGESCNGVYCVNGDVIVERDLETGELGNVENYPFEQFKWTFRKTTDGDYAFAGVEKIK